MVSDVPVQYEREGAVAWLRLNRPATLNALDRATLALLLEHLTTAADDPAVRCVVLTGNGRGFCAGGDLHAGLEEVTGSSSVTEQTRELRHWMRITELIHHMPKPVIAAVNGACVGAGLSLACACDVRLAARSARFGPAFLGAGVSGDFGGTWLLANIVGLGVAKELYLTGRLMDSDEALRRGLISAVHDDAALDSVAADLANRLATGPRAAIAAMKENFASLPQSLSGLMDLEARHHVECTASADAAEAAAAFRERRPARFGEADTPSPAARASSGQSDE